MKYKLLTICLLGMFMISFASAFSFDNIKDLTSTTFDGKQIKDLPLLEKYAPIKITNAFGLGATIFEGYLSQHDETCGIDCSSTMEIKLYEDRPLVDDVNFYTIQEDGSKVKQDVRSYQFKIWDNPLSRIEKYNQEICSGGYTDEETMVEVPLVCENVERERTIYYKLVDDYKYTCTETGKLSLNGTAETICSNVLVGKKEVIYNGWVNYNLGTEMPKGEYTVKLDAEKKPSRSVDWIIKTGGETLNEWAVWESNPLSTTVFDYLLSEDNLTITSGTTILGGDVTYNNVYVASGAILEINESIGYLNITAYNITIEGTIEGEGKSNNTGGAGGSSPADSSGGSGSEGVGYDGGNGGAGGTKAFYPPSSVGGGAGAGLYGSETSRLDFSLSSGGGGGGGGSDCFYGGGGNNANGGVGNLGGASLKLFALNILVNGGIDISGTSGGNGGAGAGFCYDDAVGGSGGGGGGGGSGGMLIIDGILVNISNSNLDIAGGTGGSGGSAGDGQAGNGATGSSGGTGKGGRIKIFSYILYNDSITVTKGISGTLYYNTPDYSTSIILNSPTNNYMSDTNLNTFNATATVTGGATVENMSLWTNESGTWAVRNTTTGLSGTTETQTWDRSLISGTTTLWNVQACDSDGDCGFSTANRTLEIDTTAPTITLQSPTGTLNYGAVGQSETLNVTFTDTNLDSCWYDYNGTNVTIDGCLTGVKNSPTFLLEYGDTDMTIWVNDTVGNTNSTYTSWDYLILENNRTHNSTSYETARETYQINVTANSSLTAIKLNYNGTDYTTTQSGNIWSYSMDVPIANVGNNSIGWKFTYAGSTIPSTYTTYQNVSETVFTLCNATYSDDFLNITFKDEADLSSINASIPTSTFTYYLGNGDVTKEYDYINTTDHYNYLFCGTPDRTIHVEPYLQYKRNSDYPQRTWNPSAIDYTSTLSTQILYLLESADGIYVTIQVDNSASQLISGVYITATREISGTDTVVAAGTTGSDGTVTFWLNPDFSHDFTLTKAGYTDYSTTFTPTQTSYTITLGDTAEAENSSIRGIGYTILPTNTYLENDTSYTFGFTLTSSYWDVDDYGFTLRLSNGTKIDGGNTGVEGTALTEIYNVNNQTIIYFDYYWLINGVYTNSSRYWVIQNTELTGWSIANFFTDLTLYLDSGIFGLDDFGRSLIVFLILFISIGIMSYKYGATSPLAVSSLIFGIIFFFDVVIGLIPTIRGITYLPTFLAFLVLTLAIFNEVRT